MRNKWDSDALCLDWAEHEAMLKHTSIRRRPDIRRDRKKGVERFVIADLISAFGAYETLDEVENAWSTIKTILAPTRIHVECVWEERFVDCCTITDFFKHIIPHISGPVANQIKRARFAQYTEDAINKKSKEFVWELDIKTQRTNYGISGMLFIFGMFETLKKAAKTWTNYKTRLGNRGEKLNFYRIGAKDACTVDEFFDSILPNIFHQPLRKPIIHKRDGFAPTLDIKRGISIEQGSETKRVKYETPRIYDVTKIEHTRYLTTKSNLGHSNLNALCYILSLPQIEPQPVVETLSYPDKMSLKYICE